MKRKILLAITVVTIMISCNNAGQKKKNNQVENQVNTEIQAEVANIYGTYQGTFPAADCEGIKTTLTINDDKTYSLISEYIGVKDGNFETNGTYNVIDETLIELVTPSSGEKKYYKILDSNRIMLSDELGAINNGELADLYILKK